MYGNWDVFYVFEIKEILRNVDECWLPWLNEIVSKLIFISNEVFNENAFLIAFERQFLN